MYIFKHISPSKILFPKATIVNSSGYKFSINLRMYMPYICTCMGLEFLMLMGSCRMYSSITLFFSIYWEKLKVQLISLYRDLTLLFLTTILLHSKDEPSCVHSFPYWCIFALVPSSYYCILEHRTSYIFKDVPYGITRNIFSSTCSFVQTWKCLWKFGFWKWKSSVV